MEAANRLAGVIAGLMSQLTEIRDLDSEHDSSIRECMAKFRGPLEEVLKRPTDLQSELDTATDIIARDILVRLTAVEESASDKSSDTATVVRQAWSVESVSALESRLSWLREEAQSTAVSDSRVLWTGPMQRQQESATSGEGSLLTTDVTDPELVSQVEGTLSNPDKVELVQEFVLEKLSFTNMTEREEEVSKAHHRTFEWVFAEKEKPDLSSASTKQSSLVPWLEKNESQIYWINGKAGSGKSTLTRYIVEHKSTRSHLEKWAGETPLCIITFFFWTSGSVLQRSQLGLLRSLLYQLLDQRRDLIPRTFPELWMSCQDTKKRIGMVLTWEKEELLLGLRRAFGMASKEDKLCLFIDGLDEFEGDEAVIIALVRDLVGLSTNIKACISSRPWAAFEKAFSNVPHMLLQDLTLADMDGFVSAQLKEHATTRSLVQQDPDGFLKFKSEMLQRAEGVFLWTSLATHSILKASSKDTTLEILLTQLLQLPSDLEDLFQYLLFKDRTAEALSRQSHAFQIVRARDTACDFTGDESVRAISLLQMALAHTGKLEDVQKSIAQANAEDILDICQKCSTMLEDECANLLIPSNPDKHYTRVQTNDLELQEVKAHIEADRKVNYLHRTVRDFLHYSGVWTKVLSNGHPNYDPHQALLLSHVLKLRSPLDPPQKHRRLDDWWHDDIVPALTHARYACPETIIDQVHLLDTLNETLDSFWRKKITDDQDTWARNAFGSYEERMKHRTPFHFPFLSLAAKFGLAEYLRVKLRDGKYAYQAGIPLLSYPLELLIDRRKTVFPLCSEEVVKVLLEAGQSPNQPYLDMGKRELTPWLLALRCVREGNRRGWIRHFDTRVEGTRRWVRVLEIMLENGADVNAVIVKDKWDPEDTALSVVSDVAGKYFSSDVERLKRELEEGIERELR